MNNYLTYVKGKRGKADPKKPKVYIGWVNQQGGQVEIGGFATNGAELAVKYVNEELGGVGGHPVQLKTCFIASPRRRARPADRSWPRQGTPVIGRAAWRSARSRSTPRSPAPSR